MSASIRMGLPADAEQIAAIYAPFCLQTAVSFEEIAPSPAEMAQRIRDITERYPWLVLDDAGRIAGYVYASQHRSRAAYRWSVDVTAYVAPEFRRRGVGRALYTALFQLLTLQGYFRAYAGVALPNPASISLHESLGFPTVGTYRRVGYKLGAWHDVRWLELALQPERPNPPQPQTVPDVAATPAWVRALATGLACFTPAPPTHA